MVEVNPYGQGTVLATGSVTFPGGAITGTAVDTAGNVYIADRFNNRIVKVDPLGTTTLLSFSAVGALSGPQGVAVDPSGNVYVMDSSNLRVILITTSGATSVVPFSGVTIGSFIFGISADANGNLLLADWGHSRLVKVNLGQSALTYANTNVGAASSDSPKTATVTDLGDQPLVFSAAPTFITSFSENAADSNPCTASTTLAAGTNCDVSIKFTPQVAGSLSANITVTNNTLNITGSTQQIAVSGTGVSSGQSTATAVSITPASADLGQAVTIAAKVTDTASGHTTTIPTGPVSFTDLVGATATQLSSGVTLDATGTATLSGVVLSGAGVHTITASYAGVSNTFLTSDNTATIAISQPVIHSTTVALVSSADPSIVTNEVAFAAAVTSSAGTPTGTVQFFDGTALLGAGTLSSGGAAYTTSALAAGSHSITAVYSGDSHFTGGTSSAVVQVVEDFTLGGAPGTPGSGTGNVPSATVVPGGTATYALSFGPSVGTVFPAPVTLSLSGLPPGATGTLSPQTLPAGSSLTAVTLTIQLPTQTAKLSKGLRWVTPALALLLLPFAGRMRRKGYALQRYGLVLVLLAAGASGIAGLSGCSAKNTGFFGQARQTYTVLITATSGSLSHSTSVTLTVQ